MVTDKGAIPEVKVERMDAPDGVVRLKLTPPDGKQIEIAVRLAGEVPVALSGGISLEGRCAVLLPDQAPQVVEEFGRY